MNEELLSLNQLQKQARRDVDEYIYDNHGNQAITPSGRTLVNKIISEAYYAGYKKALDELSNLK